MGGAARPLGWPGSWHWRRSGEIVAAALEISPPPPAMRWVSWSTMACCCGPTTATKSHMPSPTATPALRLRQRPLINRLALYYAAVAETESAKGPARLCHSRRGQRAHIVAVQAAALALKQWHVVCEIARNTQDYLDLQGYWTDRITVTGAGLDAARAAGDRRGECAFLSDLGNTVYSLGGVHRAIKLYEQQLVIAREIGDRWREGVVLSVHPENAGINGSTFGRK